MFEDSLVLFLSISGSFYYITQLGSIEEVTRVLEDVFGAIVDGFPDKDLNQTE